MWLLLTGLLVCLSARDREGDTRLAHNSIGRAEGCDGVSRCSHGT